MGRVEGKVALVTGAARGQGREFCIRLAEEGADIIAIDVPGDVDTVAYPLATAEDLDQTVQSVESLDRVCRAHIADVRDVDALRLAVEDGLATFGHIDIVCANAGIASIGASWELSEETWKDMIDINLTGAWHTVKAALPSMLEAGTGGSIILTSSAAGLKGLGMLTHYTAAKHGLVGLMRSLAIEVAPRHIRVNSVNPTNVATDMLLNGPTYRGFRSDVPDPSEEQILKAMTAMNTLPTPWVESRDVANAVLFLASDEARYITGVALPVDAGALLK